jgi:hypothetical protein
MQSRCTGPSIALLLPASLTGWLSVKSAISVF